MAQRLALGCGDRTVAGGIWRGLCAVVWDPREPVLTILSVFDYVGGNGTHLTEE